MPTVERKPGVMRRADFERLKKIMDRTRSENDHEALASLRAANRIIEASGVSWERFFEKMVRIEVEENPETVEEHQRTMPAGRQQHEVEENPERATSRNAVTRDHGAESVKNRIEAAFRAIDARGRASSFVESLRTQWDEKGFLSPKQVKALEDNALEAKYR